MAACIHLMINLDSRFLLLLASDDKNMPDNERAKLQKVRNSMNRKQFQYFTIINFRNVVSFH